MHPSPLFSLNLKDLLKGLIVAIITAAITAIQTTFQSGSLAINWKSTGAVALAAGLSYLIKNFFTPGQVIPLPGNNINPQQNHHDNI